jgi:CRP-like cAMP-binding protein
MALTVTENKNVQIGQGEIIFIQGAVCESINFLMEGEIEILTASEKDIEKAGNDEIKIIECSKRVCTLQENTFFGVDSILTGQPYNYTIRAVKESVISVYFTKKLNIDALLTNKLNYVFLMARSLVKLQQKSLSKIKSMDNFVKDIQRIKDNLGIIYAKLSKSYSVETKSTLSSFSHGIFDKFKEAGGQLPVPLSLNAIKMSNEKYLDKTYGFDDSLEKQKISFLYKFFASPSDLQMKFFQHDPFILKYLAKELADEISNITGEIEKAYVVFQEEFSHLSGEKDNWLLEYVKILAQVRKRGNESDVKLISDILNYLINLVTNVEKKFDIEFNFKIDVSAKVISTVKARLISDDTASDEASDKKSDALAEEEAAEVPEECKGMLKKLLDFSDVEEETRKEIIKSVSEFKRLEDRMSDATDVRKLRRKMATAYWKLYRSVYLVSYNSANMPKFVELFLNYGLLDETLLKKHQVAKLYTLEDKYNPKYPIYYTTDWLKKVIEKEVDPSIDELGQTYYEIMRNLHKDKMQNRKGNDLPEELNMGVDRVKFEIDNMLPSTVKTTNGQLRTAIPFLISEQFWRDIDTLRVTKQRIEKTIDEILERDFSAFHRQILYQNPQRNIFKQFVMQQVIPNFIIVPSAGINIMMWQDLDGRSKSSQGRIVLPAFASDPQNTSQYDDLFILLLKSFAVFRWELLRTVLGHAWTDPTEASLTSDYMDYIQFFKKNSKLSPEAKEKLSTEFKRFRQDRDKFVNDYLQWVVYEYDGQMKLNVVAREIFFKHCPFRKDVREKLLKSPRYSDIGTRFHNIRRKKIMEINNKYHKFTKDGLSLPEELERNLEFFNM